MATKPFVVGDPHICTVFGLFGIHSTGMRMLADNRPAFEFEDTPHLRQVFDAHKRGALQVSSRLYQLLYTDAVQQMRTARADAILSTTEPQGVSNGR